MNAPSPAPREACDLCHAALAEPHQHLLESQTRKLECVCDACAVLFGSENQRYRRVPRRVQLLSGFSMTNAQWDALMIPIGIAFLFRNSTINRVLAIYPSPAGPVESLLTLDAWDEIAASSSELHAMESDVEGLLVYRVGTATDYFIIPIDECFKLIGIIRMNWKGFSGGMQVWQEIGKFLDQLRVRASK
jgi:hypothetical protein